MNPHLTEWAWPSVHRRSRSIRTIANEPISSKSWLHDISPATLSSSGRELTEQLNALSAKILPGGAFFHRNPANLRLSKVHSRSLWDLRNAFTCGQHTRLGSVVPQRNLDALRFLPRLKARDFLGGVL